MPQSSWSKSFSLWKCLGTPRSNGLPSFTIVRYRWGHIPSLDTPKHQTLLLIHMYCIYIYICVCVCVSSFYVYILYIYYICVYIYIQYIYIHTLYIYVLYIYIVRLPPFFANKIPKRKPVSPRNCAHPGVGTQEIILEVSLLFGWFLSWEILWKSDGKWMI
jgi:hypothetical protein